MIEWSGSFDATIVVGEEVLPNSYTVKLSLVMKSLDHTEQLIAFERMKFFVNEYMPYACIVNHMSPLTDVFQTYFDQKLMQLSEEPNDRTVGAVLHKKLAAVCEGKILIETLTISSKLGSYIHYTLMNEPVPNAMWTKDVPWWNRPDLTLNDYKASQVEWTDTQLGFPQPPTKTFTVIDGGKNED